MAFSEYIKDQLLFKGRITLPGLGTLELVKESARIKGKKIIPPGTWIVFNPGLSKDDGKLAQSLASAEEIDIEEARQKVLELIDAVVFKLNKGEAFIFEGLGKLFRDNENTIQFEKDDSFIVDFDTFGLESFELETIEEEGSSPVESIQSQPDTHKTSIPAVEPQSQPPPPPQPKPQPQIVTPAFTGKNNRNIFWILSGAIVVILTGFIVLKLTTNVFDNTSFTFFNFGQNDSLMTVFEDVNQETAGTLPGELEKTLDSMLKMENALAPDEMMQDRSLLNPVESRGYKEFHIIAGSFKDTKRAQKLARDLTLRGYPARILEQGNDLYRVSALSFKDKETGLTELQRFRGQTKNNAAWLLGLN